MKDDFAAPCNTQSINENELHEAVVKASTKYAVLCQETALIAFERIANLKGQELQFVKIPLNRGETEQKDG